MMCLLTKRKAAKSRVMGYCISYVVKSSGFNLLLIYSLSVYVICFSLGYSHILHLSF